MWRWCTFCRTKEQSPLTSFGISPFSNLGFIRMDKMHKIRAKASTFCFLSLSPDFFRVPIHYFYPGRNTEKTSRKFKKLEFEIDGKRVVDQEENNL
jgi:hypothetical protein